MKSKTEECVMEIRYAWKSFSANVLRFVWKKLKKESPFVFTTLNNQ